MHLCFLHVYAVYASTRLRVYYLVWPCRQKQLQCIRLSHYFFTFWKFHIFALQFSDSDASAIIFCDLCHLCLYVIKNNIVHDNGNVVVTVSWNKVEVGIMEGLI